MKKLHKFLIKSFIPPFIATFFIAIFVLFMQFLWKWVDELVGKGLEIDIILKFVYYAAARLVPLALPIAILIASIMTFGNLGEKNELAALKSSGVSLRRIMMPLLLISILISVLSFSYSNYILPIANLKSGTLLYDIQKQKPAINIREGEFYNDIDGYSIKVDRKDLETNKLFGILIYDHNSKQSNDKVISAESGEMNFTNNGKYLELKLFNGSSYVEVYNNNRNRTFPHQRIKFKENIIRFDLKKFGLKQSDESIYKNHYSMMSINQLNHSIDSLKTKYTDRKIHFSNNYIEKFNYKTTKTSDTSTNQNYYKSELEIIDFAINKVRSNKAIQKSNTDDLKYRHTIINRHNIEWHRKFSLAFACLVLFIIGSSLGAIIRKGGFGIPILISILLFVLYHVINMMGEKQVKELTMDPFTGMWLSNLIFFPLSIFLLYKSTNDSNLLDFSYYKQSIYKFIYRHKLNKS